MSYVNLRFDKPDNFPEFFYTSLLEENSEVTLNTVKEAAENGVQGALRALIRHYEEEGNEKKVKKYLDKLNNLAKK